MIVAREIAKRYADQGIIALSVNPGTYIAAGCLTSGLMSTDRQAMFRRTSNDILQIEVLSGVALWLVIMNANYVEI